MENNIIVYTVKQVAAMLHTSPNKIYELVYKGKLKAIKIGSLKILNSNLIEFLNEYNGKDVDGLDTIFSISEEGKNV